MLDEFATRERTWLAQLRRVAGRWSLVAGRWSLVALTLVFAGPLTQSARAHYRHWRLPPGSPLIDQGLYYSAMTFELGATRFLPDTTCKEIESFDWDAEGYGNPRIVGESIDIGCDEMHMLIMAGSYANDSTAHNNNLMPTSHLHASAAPGVPTRQLITLPLFAG